MPLSPSTCLGPYEILSPLGSGGMGEVYRARDTRLDRSVAIKVLGPDVAGDAGSRSRFEREARAIAALSHPHICTLYDVGEHEGTAYLVMELLEGQTLAARLEKGALPLVQALKIFVQDFPAGTRRTQVSTNRGMQPKWRADSRELYYLQSDGALMSVQIGSGTTLDASMPRALFKGPGPKVLDPYRSDYEPSSDGQRFLMKVPASTSRPNAITVVLHWPALLARSGRAGSPEQ